MKKENFRYGDYFNTKEGKYCTFIKMDRDNNAVFSVYGEPWYKTIDIDSIEPIRITSSFLIDYMSFSIFSQELTSVSLIKEIEGKNIFVSNFKIPKLSDKKEWTVSIDDENKKLLAQEKINYVHELQHIVYDCHETELEIS